MDIVKTLELLTEIKWVPSSVIDDVKIIVSWLEEKENIINDLKSIIDSAQKEIDELSSIKWKVKILEEQQEKLNKDKKEFEETKKFREKDKEIICLKKDVECNERLVKQWNKYVEYIFKHKLVNYNYNDNNWNNKSYYENETIMDKINY